MHTQNDLPPSASEQTRLDRIATLVRAQPTPSHGFRRSNYADVEAFFAEASADYDSDLTNPYWSFTHELLRFLLYTHIKEHFSTTDQIRLFDAGAGTGNWSQFVLGINSRIQGTLFDMNPKMLEIAHPKVRKLAGNHCAIIEGNLENPDDFPAEPSNLILCMHNVIGLGRNTALMLRNMYRHLASSGIAFIMAPNMYHALAFTRAFLDPYEAQRVVQDGTVKFKSDMPEMFCYTPDELQRLLHEAGFSRVTVLGFPVTVRPLPSDTLLLKKQTTDWALHDPQERARLLVVEKQLCLNPALAYRGASSLIAICKK